MPRVWLPYDPNAGPSVTLLWRAQLPSGDWGKIVSSSALIDSGATVSAIRRADLTDMGLDADASVEEVAGLTMRDAWGNTHPAEFAKSPIVAKLAPPDDAQ